MQDDIRDTRDRQDKPEPRATETHIGPDHQLPPPKRSGGVRILVWVVILLLFALLFWWVMHHRQAPAATGGGRRAACGGTVTLTTSTAKQGQHRGLPRRYRHRNPGLYDHYCQPGHRRHQPGSLPRRSIGSPRPAPDPDRPPALPGQRAHRPGSAGARHQPAGQAEMDLKRYQDAWARNAIPKQTLDDQEKIVLQDRGNGQSRSGHAAVRPGATGLYQHHLAHHRPRRSAPGRSG